MPEMYLVRGTYRKKDGSEQVGYIGDDTDVRPDSKERNIRVIRLDEELTKYHVMSFSTSKARRLRDDCEAFANEVHGDKDHSFDIAKVDVPQDLITAHTDKGYRFKWEQNGDD